VAARIRHWSVAARLRVPIPPVHGYLFFVIFACCQVGGSASGRSLVETMVCLTERHREALLTKRPRPTRDCCAMKNPKHNLLVSAARTAYVKGLCL